MEKDIRGGLAQVFWNREEGRLRTPLRFVVALLLVLVFTLALGLVAFLLGLVVDDFGPRLAAVAELLSLLALTGGVLGIIWLVDRRTFADIGLGFDARWRREFGVGLASGTAMAGLTAGIVLLAGGTISGVAVTRDGALFADLSFGAGVLVAAAFFLTIAFIEELVFRGYLLVNIAEGLRTAVEKRRAVLLALGITAVLFGVAHAGNPDATAGSTLNITLFGLLLGGVYVTTDSLAAPIGLHTTWNFVLGPVFGLPVSGLTSGVALVALEPAGPSWLTGGAFGPEGGAVALLALLAGTGLLGLWLHRTTGGLSVREQIAEPDIRGRE